MKNETLAPGSFDADFAVIVEGDGMTDDRIHDGDIVYIHAQNTAEDGQIAAVILDGTVHLGRYWRTEWGFFLQPSNAAYSSKIFRTEEGLPEIVGIAVAAHIHLPAGEATE